MIVAIASFSQNANLLRSFITRHYKSSKVQALFVNLIYEDHVLYAKPKNEVLFVRIKLLYAELSTFQIKLFMVHLSQILNIRHLEIPRLIQTILISTVFLKNNSMQTDIVSDGINRLLFARLYNVGLSYTGAFSDYIFEH